MRLYIDPGTGSMLFTILLGVLGVVLYSLRTAFVKLRFFLRGGKTGAEVEKGSSIVIFTDSKRYWNVFEPICDEFEKRGEDLEYLTASPDDPALTKSYEHVRCVFIGENNKACAYMNTLRADIVLSSTPSLDVFYWKRSGNVKWYVHIGHACSDLTLYHMFGIDYFDAILISGEYQAEQIRALEKLRDLPEKELPMVGVPHLDTMKARLSCSDIPDHQRTVLLGPSWGKSGILTTYGGEIIRALLKTGYHIIIRPHPQSFVSEGELMDALMKEFPESEQLEWNRDNDNFEVLRRSDILISDFSGVVFDFSLVFDRPVIYADAAFDKGPYDAWWLDEEPWTLRILPEIGRPLKREDLQNMKELIDSSLLDTGLKQARDRARAETWVYPGEGAKRTADYLIQKRNEINGVKQ